MSLVVTCPSCSSSFKSPDSAAGKKAKCPKCGGTIQIPGATPVEEIVDAEEAPNRPFDDDDFDMEPPAALPAVEDRKPCPMCGEMIQRDAVKCRFCGEVFDRSMAGILGSRATDLSDPRWSKVRTGLATLYYSLITVVLAIILMIVSAAVLGGMNVGQPGANPPGGLIIVVSVCLLVMLGAGIASLVGYALCASVPEVSGARGFVIGSIICLVANVVLSMAGGAVQNQALSSLGSFVALAGWILFILFIRASASYLGNTDLASSATRFLILGGILLASTFVLGVVAAIGQAPALLIVIGLSVLVAGLIAFVWYMRLLQGLMKTIDERTH